jgi:hypothetical protein
MQHFTYCALASLVALSACASPAGGPIPSGASGLTSERGGSTTSPNLIVNGSFEKPTVPSGSYTLFNTGDSFTGWKVVGASGNVAIISHTFVYGGYACPAGCGKQWLDLTGTSDSRTGVEQTVTVTKGTTYAISFKVGNAYASGTKSTVIVFVNGKRIFRATNKAGKNVKREVWRNFSTTFIAASNSADIRFLNGDPSSDTDNGLDCVTVTAQ